MNWITFWNYAGWVLFWLIGVAAGWLGKDMKDHPDDWFD